MDEQQLNLLLELVQSGTNEAGINDANTLREIIENEGVEVLYNLMPEGAVRIRRTFPFIKKKRLESTKPKRKCFFKFLTFGIELRYRGAELRFGLFCRRH